MHRCARLGRRENVEISKELLRGSTAILVLKLLEKEDMYGYQIIKELGRTSKGVFNLKEGTLYPILHSLERGGLVESYWEDTTSKRKRKYYRLTAAGQDALTVRTREWIFSGRRWTGCWGAEKMQPIEDYLDVICSQIGIETYIPKFGRNCGPTWRKLLLSCQMKGLPLKRPLPLPWRGLGTLSISERG